MKRNLTIAALIYGFLIFYGSIMPFDFSATAEQVRQHWDRAFTIWPFGHTEYNSRSAEIANFLFYIPLGGMIAAARAVGGRSRGGALVLGAIVGALLSVTVETLQLFCGENISPKADFDADRVADMCDVIVNSAGRCWGRWREHWRGGRCATVFAPHRRRRWKTVALAAVVLMIALAIDAWCPWVPMLSPSGIWGNLKRSCWGLTLHSWDHWIISRAAVYGARSDAAGLVAQGGRKPSMAPGRDDRDRFCRI